MHSFSALASKLILRTSRENGHTLIDHIALIHGFLSSLQTEQFLVLMIIIQFLFVRTLMKNKNPLVLHQVGMLVFNDQELQSLLCNHLEIITPFQLASPLTPAVFLDIEADALRRSKLPMLNLLGAVVIVARALVIAALHAIRFLSTL